MLQAKPKLLPTGPMARMLRVPVRWLKSEAAAGRVPCVQAENIFLFDPETVERVLLERARDVETKHDDKN